MRDRIFSPGEALDPTYVNLRSRQEDWIAPARAFVESLWDRFHGFADPNFLTEIRRDFHARFWEMYLTCALHEYATQRGIAISCPKPGPDILLEHEGNRVWVEAVIATNGMPGRPDSVVQPNADGSSRIPEEKIVLRYTNALSEKYGKYRRYLRKGIVRKSDAFVVAINGAALSWKGIQAADDVPRFLKALYPLGPFQLVLDRRTGETIRHQNQPRFNIVKASGDNVAVMPFLERGSRGITAVLGSLADVMYHGTPLGSDFELAHNPMGRAPISDVALPAYRAWRAVLSENGGGELNGLRLA
jgi:hypothetical protein